MSERSESNGGGGGIRTHEDLATLPLFESGLFNQLQHPTTGVIARNEAISLSFFLSSQVSVIASREIPLILDFSFIDNINVSK